MDGAIDFVGRQRYVSQAVGFDPEVSVAYRRPRSWYGICCTGRQFLGGQDLFAGVIFQFFSFRFAGGGPSTSIRGLRLTRVYANLAAAD